MTKRKAKKQAEPSTFDRLSDAADRLFGEAFASIPEQIRDYMHEDIDNPEVPDIAPEEDQPQTVSHPNGGEE